MSTSTGATKSFGGNSNTKVKAGETGAGQRKLGGFKIVSGSAAKKSF